MVGNSELSKTLQGWKTSAQIAKAFNITDRSARNWVKRLSKTRKVQTKKIETGKQGRPSFAFKVH